MAKPAQSMTLPGSIHIDYEWTIGIAATRFFQELKDNKRIMGVKCPKCSRIIVPPRIFCEDCFVETTEWVPVGPKGELVTFAGAYLSPDGAKLDKPWVLGIVKLDGSDGGLIHFIDADIDDLKVGMRMEPVFAEQRKGHILDIKHFRPVKN